MNLAENFIVLEMHIFLFTGSLISVISYLYVYYTRNTPKNVVEINWHAPLGPKTPC